MYSMALQGRHTGALNSNTTQTHFCIQVSTECDVQNLADKENWKNLKSIKN